MKAGDTKEATVNFPDDYGAEHLAGKEAVFACTIKAVKAPAEAAIDDDLAKQFGADDLDALKARSPSGWKRNTPRRRAPF